MQRFCRSNWSGHRRLSVEDFTSSDHVIILMFRSSTTP
jgi:hypothetical protein